MDKLIDSPLAYAHHHYVIFLKLHDIKNVNQLVSIFPESKKEKIKLNDKEFFFHVQTEIPRRYGTLSVLEFNKTKVLEKKQFYVYDFFVGVFSLLNDDYFFISYPYLSLGKYLEKLLKKSSLTIKLQKPDVGRLLKYMKSNKGSVVYDGGKFKAEIIQYGAEIVDDGTVISISGINPLQSKIYRKLEDMKDFKIEPVRLKLQCKNSNGNQIQLSFDRLGNYRFWVGEENQKSSIASLPNSFRVFKEGDAVNEESFINEFSILDDGRT